MRPKIEARKHTFLELNMPAALTIRFQINMYYVSQMPNAFVLAKCVCPNARTNTRTKSGVVYKAPMFQNYIKLYFTSSFKPHKTDPNIRLLGC